MSNPDFQQTLRDLVQAEQMRSAAEAARNSKKLVEAQQQQAKLEKQKLQIEQVRLQEERENRRALAEKAETQKKIRVAMAGVEEELAMLSRRATRMEEQSFLDEIPLVSFLGVLVEKKLKVVISSEGSLEDLGDIRFLRSLRQKLEDLREAHPGCLGTPILQEALVKLRKVAFWAQERLTGSAETTSLLKQLDESDSQIKSILEGAAGADSLSAAKIDQLVESAALLNQRTLITETKIAEAWKIREVVGSELEKVGIGESELNFLFDATCDPHSEKLLERTRRHHAELKRAEPLLKHAKADWIHDRDLLESAKACLAEKKYGEVESALKRIKRTNWTDFDFGEIQGFLTAKRDNLLKEVEVAASDKAAAIRLAQTLVEEYRTSLTIADALKKRAVELGHELAMQKARKRRNRMLLIVLILLTATTGTWMVKEQKVAVPLSLLTAVAAGMWIVRELRAAAQRAERMRIAMAEQERIAEVEAKERRDKAIAEGIRDKEGRLFVAIPEGAFQMGSNSGNSKPVRSVQVSAFFIAETEVTWGEWRSVWDWAQLHGYEISEGKGTSDKHPVTDVSWYDCVKWCNAKSEKEGLRACYQVNGGVYRKGDESTVRCEWNANGYRLPTEAEWEKAARGGFVEKEYPNGDLLQKKNANFDGSGTVEVGRYAPNGYGLRDMAGNVWEWCWDRYGEYPVGDGAALMNPQGPEQGVLRVLRGGSWFDFAASCRAANRDRLDPGDRDFNLGIRPALVPSR